MPTQLGVESPKPQRHFGQVWIKNVTCHSTFIGQGNFLVQSYWNEFFAATSNRQYQNMMPTSSICNLFKCIMNSSGILEFFRCVCVSGDQFGELKWQPLLPFTVINLVLLLFAIDWKVHFADEANIHFQSRCVHNCASKHSHDLLVKMQIYIIAVSSKHSFLCRRFSASAIRSNTNAIKVIEIMWLIQTCTVYT